MPPTRARTPKSRRAVSKKSKKSKKSKQSRRKSGGRRGGGGGASNLTDEEVEQQMINVLKLTPGESAKFLWTTVYLIDLRTSALPKIDPENPTYTYFPGLHIPCQRSIGQKYIDATIKKSHYAMIAICNDNYHSGVQAVVFIHPDVYDPKGLEVPLSCNRPSVWGIRVAHLLKVAIFNFAKEQLGFKHVYNAAATLDLVGFHAKSSGMTLRDKDCDVEDDDDDAGISRTFNTLTNSKSKINYTYSVVKSPNSKYKMDNTASYPMKLCNFNVKQMFDELRDHTLKKYREGLNKGFESQCEF